MGEGVQTLGIYVTRERPLVRRRCRGGAQRRIPIMCGSLLLLFASPAPHHRPAMATPVLAAVHLSEDDLGDLFLLFVQ